MNRSVDVEFETLKWLTGPLYTEKRDAWLASTPDARSRLVRDEQDPDWRTSVTATILLGWLDHRASYDEFLKKLDDPEPWKKAQQTIMGLNAVWKGYGMRVREDPAFGTMIFPLCLEAVLKRHGEWWDPKTKTFFDMLRQKEDERSIEPLLWYLQNIAEDYQERDRVGATLRLFPTEPLRTRIAKLYVDQRAVREALEHELDGRHLPKDASK
jgi:hypothetical protein